MNIDVQRLYDMLTFKRPRGGPTEGEYINRFLRPLGVKDDRFGNLHLTIGENPTVLWSSHTDTVHQGEGHQHIELDNGFIRLAAKSKSSCLGADCAAGNWVMMAMIEAQVPGLYIFHFGEEHGQIGSNQIRTETPEVLAGIKAAIAFDRRGTRSVITHQRVRTCSDAFGQSMIDQLPGFKLDDGGTVTDTKVYRGLVPECTNLSVGYHNEHTPTERLDVAHLVALRNMMIKIDPTQFVIEREPVFEKAKEFSIGKYLPVSNRASTKSGGPSRNFGSFFEPNSILELLHIYPDDVAATLEEEGISFDDLQQMVTMHRLRMRIRRQRTLDPFFDENDPDGHETHTRKIA